MAETPEAGAKRQVRAVLAAHHVYVQVPTTGGYGRSGVLDFTVCAFGKFVGIEVKSIHSRYGKKGPTALQWEEIDAIRKAGGIAVSIDESNIRDLHDLLVHLCDRNVIEADRVALKTLDRHTRPSLTPDTDTQPIKRKKP